MAVVRLCAFLYTSDLTQIRLFNVTCYFRPVILWEQHQHTSSHPVGCSQIEFFRHTSASLGVQSNVDWDFPVQFRGDSLMISAAMRSQQTD